MAPPIVIDGHAHCFHRPGDPSFPDPASAPYTPHIEAPPEGLLACMDAAGVVGAVVVHPEPYLDDHRYLEHCLDVGGPRFRGVCRFLAEKPGAIEGMTRLVERRGRSIVGVRIHAYNGRRLPPFGSDALREFWRAAGDLGLVVQLHFEPRFAAGFTPLIREFPATTVVVDHLGRPLGATPEEYEVVLDWAALPNVVVKLSHLSRPDEYPHGDVAPFVASLIDAFGPSRLLTGTNFGAGSTIQSYAAHFERLASLLGGLSDAERAEILGGTAARAFGFGAEPIPH